MKHLLKLTTGILLLAGSFPAHGQFSAPGGLPPGLNHALLDVLGGGVSFYGRATIQLPNGPDKQPTSVSASIAVLGGNMRVEADAPDPGPNLSPVEATKL